MFGKSKWFNYAGDQGLAGTASLDTTHLKKQSLGAIDSGLSDPFQQTHFFRASAITSQVIPDPGNTRTTAYNLGSLGSSPITLSDSVGSSDQNDYYQFSTSTSVNFNLSLSGLTADADVQLLSTSGVVLKSSVNPNNQNEAISQTLNPGTYYVRVYQYRGNTNYTLTLAAENAPSAPTQIPGRFNSSYGYGLVDAAASVSQAINQGAFAPVANLGGNYWDLDQINAPEVWARGYTGQGVVVAVVDSGVDYTHPDLDNNIWINPLEIAGNGVDDDRNGFIDDIRGWDFVDGDNTPTDLDGHGTHVSGTIAAENNGIGAIGVAYNAQIMPVRVLGADGSGSSANVAAGIRYAADNGADVINLSLGGGLSTAIQSAVQYAVQQGSVVVMASGNEGQSQPGYPARLSDQYGIAVGAVDINKTLASFSNRAGSSPSSFVVAPGVNIYSTTPNNTYSNFSGTSMATPHVAGVAALILSANPDLTPTQVTNLLNGTANPNGITA